MEKFRKEDIDRSIVCALADLDGCNHPLGFKMKKGKEDQKGFTFIPRQLLYFAAGYGGKEGSEPHVTLNTKPETTEKLGYETFAASCDGWQKQAVQHLIKMFANEAKERNSKIAVSNSHYLLPLSMENYFGRTVLLLAKAFEVEIEAKSELENQSQ